MLAAQESSRDSEGHELNPAWAIYARARLTPFEGGFDTEMREALWEGLAESGATSSALRTLFQRGIRALPREATDPSLMAAAAVLASYREQCVSSQGTNHSWPTFSRPAPPINIDPKRASAALERLIVHSRWLGKNHKPRKVARVRIADSRDQSHPKEDVGMILTSPPYLSRLDYIAYSEPELELLRHLGLLVEDVRTLRKRQVGSVLTSGVNIEPDSLPPRASALVKRVEKHSSKGSRSYYSKFIAAYLKDLSDLAVGLQISSRSDASAWLVIQDSWYKDFRIPTGALCVEAFVSAGWRCARRWRYQAGPTLSSLSGRTHGWRESSPLFESVMAFEKGAA